MRRLKRGSAGFGAVFREIGQVGHSGSSGDGRVRVGRPVTAPGGRSRFGLTGVSQDYDPRTVAIRADLADIALAGQHFAPHYAAPMMRSVTTATALRAARADDADIVTQLLPGEGFALLDVTGGVAWGYRLADHQVGYCPADCLGSPIAPSHRVVRADAGLYDAPGALEPRQSLPAGSLVMGSIDGNWLQTPHGWMQLADLEDVAAASGA
jgi:hypothetical protein